MTIVDDTSWTKGWRLEELVDDALDTMKSVDIIKDYKRYLNDDSKPDFEVDDDIGIEIKNWDPDKKTTINKHVLETKIISRFKGRGWKKKVLIIPKLRFYPPDEKECRNILRDYIIIELGYFVTKDNEKETMAKLLDKLPNIFM